MRRFLTSILIITVFAVQSVSFSHVHPSCAAEVAGHHSRVPHFHMHGEHRHAAHREGSQDQSDEQESSLSLREVHHPDHDFDACYLPDSLASSLRLTTANSFRFSHMFTLGIAAERFEHPARVPQQRIWQSALWAGSNARVPLYLQSLAILC